jgi:hypothetical protein
MIVLSTANYGMDNWIGVFLGGWGGFWSNSEGF